jgi:hypothetical protein
MRTSGWHNHKMQTGTLQFQREAFSKTLIEG